MKCTTMLHGGVRHRTSTPHKSGNKMEEKKKCNGRSYIYIYIYIYVYIYIYIYILAGLPGFARNSCSVIGHITCRAY